MKQLSPLLRCEKSSHSARKIASGDFFSNPTQTSWELPLEAQLLCREKRLESTTTASGVLFYGYRYYLPYVGKWINRDPIGERGGNNLYGFVYNDAVNLIDYLGREPVNSSAFSPVKADTYNCSGLANKTFNKDVASPGENLKDIMKRGGKEIKCADECEPCEIKQWHWEYKLYKTGPAGRSRTVDDYHTVAGQSDCNTGADPVSVYSKNGPRAVQEGSPQDFKPQTKGPAKDRNNNPSKDITDHRYGPGGPGSPIIERCFCIPEKK